MSKPTVSILIDTYNHERFVEQALTSALEQDFPQSDVEILVVDDGSTDRTPEILRKFLPRIRIITRPNGGQASAFNAGIPETKGEIVAFLDGDDWWMPSKLARVLETFAAEPDLGAVGHGEIFSYPDGREMFHVLQQGSRFRATTLEGARLFRLRRSCFGTSRMAVRADILRRTVPVPQALVVEADEYVATIAAVLSDVRVLAEPLVHYRVHDANGFQITGRDPSRTLRKQKVLAALAGHLTQKLGELAVAPHVIHEIVDIVQAEADELRLSLGDGWSWETVKTEWKTYEVMCPDAPPSHRVFKMLSLALALAVPPRDYYGFRHWLSESGLYHSARKLFLPMPEPQHVIKSWRQ